jgi:hypothetical protein
MRLLAALIVCAALIAACGEDDEEPAATPGGSAAVADLVVEVEPGGKRAVVQCDAEADCPEIAAVEPEVFEPTPGNVACTQQYGGPETATVTGTFKGEPVDAKFSRQNGCEISRWEDAAPILEAAK